MSPTATLRRTSGTTVRACADRIVDTYRRATPEQRAAGARWYGQAGALVDDLASTHGITREHAAAVVAHLSPRTPWARNVSGARRLLADGTAPACLSANVDRARRALESPTPLETFGPGAPKTSRFARNILGETDPVTVDVWAARVALGDRATDATLKRVGVYDALEHAYRLAARRLDLAPSEVQATTWIVARNGREA